MSDCEKLRRQLADTAEKADMYRRQLGGMTKSRNIPKQRLGEVETERDALQELLLKARSRIRELEWAAGSEGDAGSREQ